MLTLADRIRELERRGISKPLTSFTTAVCILLSIVYIAVASDMVYDPGSAPYSNLFVGMILACCLIFQCIQQFFMSRGFPYTTLFRTGLRFFWTTLYWLLHFVSWVACAVGYSMAGNVPGIVFGVTGAFLSKCTLFYLVRTKCRSSNAEPLTARERNALLLSRRLQSSCARRGSSAQSQGDDIEMQPTVDSTPNTTRKNSVVESQSTGVSQSESRARRYMSKLPSKSIWFTILRAVNRFFRVASSLIAVLNTWGAISLGLQYRLSNPGTVIKIMLPGFEDCHAVNYFCTPPSRNATNPTIWFEGSTERGVMDFLGVQTTLSRNYNLSSCSYDPPNWGWSAPQPSAISSDYTGYLPAIVQALGQQDTIKLYVGWEALGFKLALKHALGDVNTTAGVVDIDGIWDDIDFRWLQYRHGDWTQGYFIAHHHRILKEQLTQLRLILAAGQAWGYTRWLHPANEAKKEHDALTTPGGVRVDIGVPGSMVTNNTTPTSPYFSPSLAPTYRAQQLKDAGWAMKYYRTLLAQNATGLPNDDYFNHTVLPPSVKLFTLLTAVQFPANSYQSDFYFVQKSAIAEMVAGGNSSTPGPQDVANGALCSDYDCWDDFVVKKVEFAAAEIAAFVGSFLAAHPSGRPDLRRNDGVRRVV